MMRDSSLGEVESLFSEMLFSEWLSDDKKIDKLRKNGVSFFGLPNSELKQDAKILKAIDLDDFVKRSNSVLDENIASEHDNNEYWYRYTKGYVIASTVRAEYNKNSKKTMKHLSEFLEYGNEMNTDEAVAVFFGKYKKGARHNKYNFNYSKEVFKEIQEREYQRVKNNPSNKLPGVDLIRSHMPQIEGLDNTILSECRDLIDGESSKTQVSYDSIRTQTMDNLSKKGQENQQERENS